jgi:hypothetical protein
MWFLGSLAAAAHAHPNLARAREACLADEAACDELRFRLATRWARGEVGAGPQEPWRAAEVQETASRPAAPPCLDAPEGCPFPESPPRADPTTLLATARSDTLVAQLVLGSAPGMGVQWMPVLLRSARAGESFSLELLPGALLTGDAVFKVPPDGELRRPQAPGCLSLVRDPTGAPAEGALVISPNGVSRTGPDGLAVACSEGDYAVLGDALAVRRGTWTLALVAGARTQCAFEGTAPVPCDELLLGHPERTTGLLVSGAPRPDGVVPVSQGPVPSGTARRNRLSWDPHGPTCPTAGRLHRCPGATNLQVVDETGAPTFVEFNGAISDFSGKVLVGPGFDPGPGPYTLDPRRGQLVVHGRRRSGPRMPALRWSDWKDRDAAAMAEAALEALPSDAVRLSAGLAIEAFPGGAVLVRAGERAGLIGFADEDTAVVQLPDHMGRRIVELGR